MLLNFLKKLRPLSARDRIGHLPDGVFVALVGAHKPQVGVIPVKVSPVRAEFGFYERPNGEEPDGHFGAPPDFNEFGGGH